MLMRLILAAKRSSPAAVLSFTMVMVGPSIAWAAEFRTHFQEATVSAEFDWHNGDIADEDKNGFRSEPAMPSPLFSARATVRGPALIRGAAYQDQNGVNAVSADSGVALSELPSFSAQSRTNFRFVVSEEKLNAGTIDFEFVINGGELRFRNFNNLVPGNHDRVNVVGTILVGVSTTTDIVRSLGNWIWITSLEKSADGAADLDVVLVDDFGVGSPSISPVMIGNDVVVTIPSFHGVIPVDRAAFHHNPPGDIGASFAYGLDAIVELRDQADVSGLARLGDPFGLAMGGPSTNGVEFFLDGMRLGDIPLIPEPTSAVLLIFGITLSHRLRGTRVFANRFKHSFRH